MADNQSDWDLPPASSDQFKGSPTYKPPRQEDEPLWPQVKREAAIGAATGGAIGLGVGAVTGPGALVTGGLGAIGGAVSGAAVPLARAAYRTQTGQEPPWWFDPAVGGTIGLAEGGVPAVGSLARSALRTIGTHGVTTGAGLIGLGLLEHGGDVMRTVGQGLQYVGLGTNRIADAIVANAGLAGAGLYNFLRNPSLRTGMFPLIGATTPEVAGALSPTTPAPSASALLPLR